MKKWIAGITAAAVIGLYVFGAFDTCLVRAGAGLNFDKCYANGFGVVVCCGYLAPGHNSVICNQ